MADIQGQYIIMEYQSISVCRLMG